MLTGAAAAGVVLIGGANLGTNCARRGLWQRMHSGSGDALLGHLPHQVLIGLAVLVSAAGDDDCWQLVQHRNGLLLHAGLSHFWECEIVGSLVRLWGHASHL